MSFIKSLKTKRGQSSIEYIVLFAIIAVLTLLGVSELFPRIQSAGQYSLSRSLSNMH
ncbi:MAG: class III signal peptide-containing protein [Candidatus Omnitrophica bacterium]|nr:class III signal peptide-containing protein [Candidatus Omnitrophota bacterium]MBU1869554.1 class III signal peptide-containing protein [Candidatus Omnitrophota bacterium]